jgi:hypothetical protein
MANLVTLQQYKDFAGLQSLVNDARITIVIGQVSQLIKTYCGTTIIDYASTNKVEYKTIKDSIVDTIILDESPLIQVVSVEERTSQADAYTTLITDNSDSSGKYEYVVDDESDSIIRTNSTSNKYWPKGVKAAVFDLIKYYMKDERKERMQIAGASVENQISSSLAGNIGFPDHIKRILDMYKIYS